MKNSLGFSGLIKMLQVQVVLMLLLCVGLAMVYGRAAAMSSALGALAYIIPESYFAWLVFRSMRLNQLKSIFSAEVKKLILVVLIFSITFSQCSVLPVAYFLSFLAMHGMVFLSPVYFKSKFKESSV